MPAENLITKTLDNLVGKLWQQNQARQDSEGSSAGNQVRLKCNWQKYERNNFTIARIRVLYRSLLFFYAYNLYQSLISLKLSLSIIHP